MAQKDDDRPRGFASPPCFMHELDPAFRGMSDVADPVQHTDTRRWRNAERARLIATRLALGADMRRLYDARIGDHLDGAIDLVEGAVVGAYWPIRGEPDIVPLLRRLICRGGHCALPVVVEREKPLVFRVWSPDEPLVQDILGIPVPKNTAKNVVPDVIIAPAVGFDRGGYRLGYGGGYYDRTIATLPHHPRLLGVGYAFGAVATIYPQPNEVPMERVITENGVSAPLQRE